MSEHSAQDDSSFEEAMAALQAQIDLLDIPSNIDPRLLALWIQREQNEIEQKRKNYVKLPKRHGRTLDRLFAAYIGIGVMCLSVVLGLIQRQEPTAILQTTCIVFLTYAIIGVFVGVIAERCVHDSVESLLRDIVQRSRETTQKSEDNG